MWWIKDPDRLKREVSAVDALRENEPWLSAATPRLTEKLELAFDFDLLVNEETLAFTLRYPAFFPETPPLVIPRDGGQLSNHQYGNGGELCLEYRPDNWELQITGARLIESAYRLLSTEMSPSEERAIVASEHSVSLGQQLRGWAFRFLLTREIMKYIADLPIDACSGAIITDMLVPPKNFTAYIKTLGSSDDPDWQEITIPDRGDTGVQGVLIRIASLADFPLSPEQATLDQLIASAREVDAAPTNTDTDRYRFTVVADAHSATMFYSYFKEGRWGVFPYRSVHLTDDAEQRLPETYHVLANKKVGIVGCGALGIKDCGKSGAKRYSRVRLSR